MNDYNDDDLAQAQYELTQAHYEVAAANGVSRRVLQNRVNQYCWEIDRAITTPPIMRKREVSDHWLAVAAEHGIDRNQYVKRLVNGWDEEDAATTTKEEAIRRAAMKRRKLSPEEVGRAAAIGLTCAVVFYRLHRGWSKEEALSTPLVPASQRRNGIPKQVSE